MDRSSASPSSMLRHLSGVLSPAGVSEGDPELSHSFNDGDHGLNRVREDDGAISLAFFGGVALLVNDFHLKGGGRCELTLSI